MPSLAEPGPSSGARSSSSSRPAQSRRSKAPAGAPPSPPMSLEWQLLGWRACRSDARGSPGKRQSPSPPRRRCAPHRKRPPASCPALARPAPPSEGSAAPTSAGIFGPPAPRTTALAIRVPHAPVSPAPREAPQRRIARAVRGAVPSLAPALAWFSGNGDPHQAVYEASRATRSCALPGSGLDASAAKGASSAGPRTSRERAPRPGEARAPGPSSPWRTEHGGGPKTTPASAADAAMATSPIVRTGNCVDPRSLAPPPRRREGGPHANEAGAASEPQPEGLATPGQPLRRTARTHAAVPDNHRSRPRALEPPIELSSAGRAALFAYPDGKGCRAGRPPPTGSSRDGRIPMTRL